MIPFIAFWFACITGLPQKIVLTNRKPFTCPKCCSFHLALIWQLIHGFTIDSLWIVPMSSFMAVIIDYSWQGLKLPTNR